MENFETQFCKLCLNSICDTNYRVIDGVAREILDNVLLKLRFDDAHKQVICSRCSEKLDAAFKFKSTCLHTSEVIAPYINFGNLATVDIKEIYLKGIGTGELVDEEICRLCMQPVIKEFLSVFEIDVDNYRMYIPEVNFGATVNPIICKLCVSALTVHSAFIKDCLNVEEKIKHFFAGKTLESPVDVSHLNLFVKSEEIKQEKDNEMIFKSEISFDRIEEMDKEVEPLKVKKTDIKLEYIEEESFPSSQGLEEGSETSGLPRKRKDVTIENTSFAMKIDESSLNITDFEAVSNEEQVGEVKVQTDICENINSPNSYMFNDCDLWMHKTKPEFKMHMGNPKKHTLIHEDVSKTQYECEVCNCKFKNKKNLNNHLLTHMDASEIQWHECDVCDYKAKRKCDLNAHLLIHKNASETKLYECDICDFKSKHRRSIHRHNLNKHTIKEVTIPQPASEMLYKCEVCHYTFKNKDNLNKHMIVHKDDSEIQWYECDICSYKAKRKNNFNNHMLIHKDASEIQWYECDVCDYKSKHKRVLRLHNLNKHGLNHMLIDRDAFKMQYECEICHCKFSRKYNLNNHLLIHKDASEIQWFVCDMCGYKAKRKSDLNGHMLIHKNASEIQWYECDICDYKTKRRTNLKGHMITHKSASEIQWHECDLCDFRSKHKWILQRHNSNKHMLIHMDASEKTV